MRYRALVEATAFGALTIIERLEKYGVEVNEVITCGGLPGKNSLLMQVYADVINRSIKIAESDQTCAVGAAICGAVAAGKNVGGFETIEDAQKTICSLRNEVYKPNPESHSVYEKLYEMYQQIHDAFGTKTGSSILGHVMKKLIVIREQQRE